MEMLNRLLATVARYLPDDTARIQAALWAVVVLTLIYGVWEAYRRRRAPKLGEAALIALPGGERPAGERFRLTGEDVTLGRGSESQLRLAGSAVAVRHAAIVGEGGDYWLKDLGSHAGVRLNGRRQQQSTALRDGDVLQVGDQSFRF